MNTCRQFTCAALLIILCAGPGQVSGAKSSIPDERDQQVLEALLLHLITSPDFNMTRVSTNEATIVLDGRTPEKTGFLIPEQMHSDMGRQIIPSDVERDLRMRNTVSDAKPDTYKAVTAYYTKLVFSARIQVGNLPNQVGAFRRPGSFEEDHPKARGWVRSYLPGYSKKGTTAVVRANAGPSPHGATVTALLEKRGEKWLVRWLHVARYV